MPEPLKEPYRAIDEAIADGLRAAQASGELARAASWGKPLKLGGDGWDATPPELQMPMKILKDAGIVPLEVTLMHRIAELRAQVEAGAFAGDADAQRAARQRLSELAQDLALRLEHLRVTRAL